MPVVEGDEQPASTIPAPVRVGTTARIDRRPRSGTVEALGDVTAALMPMAALDGYLDAHRRVGLVLTQEVTGRLRDATAPGSS